MKNRKLREITGLSYVAFLTRPKTFQIGMPVKGLRRNDVQYC